MTVAQCVQADCVRPVSGANAHKPTATRICLKTGTFQKLADGGEKAGRLLARPAFFVLADRYCFAALAFLATGSLAAL